MYFHGDKEKEVEKLQKAGKKVIFVGDGINDSPALSRADNGLAIGSGTDIAIESADVVLIKNDLYDVVTSIDLSKKTINNIKLSLFWAFFYNIICIPIAAGILYPSFGIKLSPMIGAAAMSLSSVCVVTNALRLRKFKPVRRVQSTSNNEKNNMEKINNVNNDVKEGKSMKNISIEGMMCDNCKKHVEKALSKIEGVTKVEVSLENKNAIIETSKEIENAKIIKAIKEEGYEVKDIN